MPDFSDMKNAGFSAGLTALNKARKGFDKTVKVASLAGGAVAASLTQLHDFALDPDLINRVSSAATNHGVAAADLIGKLPGELEKYGTDAVNAFLSGGDRLGKELSHIQSRMNSPDRASDPTNVIWEDGSINRGRSSADMGLGERAYASIDNHWDGLVAAARTPEFWQRTLGNAVEASAYTAAITAVDQLLIHRDELVNSTNEVRQERLLEILKTSGLMAAGALPVSVFLAVALMIIPGMSVVMGPLGIIGGVGLGLRLISSAVNNPTQQERLAIQQLQGLLRQKLYELQRDSDGNLTITVQAFPST